MAGVPAAFIGDTLGDPLDPRPLPGITVEEPTISMVFSVNASPLAGREGSSSPPARSRSAWRRKSSITSASRWSRAPPGTPSRSSARGELQLAVLIEMMRREGFELSLYKPRVITREVDGKLSEPLELAVVDVPDEFVGIVTEKLSARRGRMVKMINHGYGRVRLEFEIPSRGLIGLRGIF